MVEEAMSESITKIAEVRKPINMLYLIIGAVVICVLSLLIGYFVLNTIAKNRYEALLQDMKSKGEPISFSGIPIADVPANVNPAEYIDQAKNVYIDLQDTIDEDADEDYWFLADNQYENYLLDELRKNPDRQRIIRNFLQQNKKAYDLLHKGLQYPKANFNIDYEDCYSDHDYNVLQFNDLFNFSIDIAILDDDSARLVELLIDMFRYAFVRKDEHLWIKRILLDYLTDLATDRLKIVRKNYELSEEQIDTILSELMKYEMMQSLTDVLISERCFTLNEYENNIPSKTQSGILECFFNYDFGRPRLKILVKIDALHYIEELGKIVELSRKPIHINLGQTSCNYGILGQ